MKILSFLLTVLLSFSCSFGQSFVQAEEIREDPQFSTIGDVIRSCSFQRNDFLLIGDSNTLYSGTGWDDGIQYALNVNYPMYASGMVFFGENHGSGAGVGFGYSVLSNASSHNFNYPGSALWNPNQSIELALSSTVTGVGIGLAANSPLGQNDGIRFHYEVQTFLQSGGSFRTGVQSGVYPYTALARFTRYQTFSTNPSLIQMYSDFPSNMGNGSIQFKMGIDGIFAPFAGTWCRAENTLRSFGFSVHTWYGFGGQSARGMAAAFNESTIAELGKYLQDATKLQTAGSFTIVRINTGLNDRNEATPSILSGFPGDSADAYVENITFVCDRILAAWSAINKNPDQLYFVISMSHAISEPNDSELISYETALPRIQINIPHCSIVKISQLTNYNEMLNWYTSSSDHLHLKTAAYEALAYREIQSLVNP